MSDEWKKGYSEGFSDGYMKAYRELTDTKPIPWNQHMTTEWKGCRVCGMKWDKPMGYVCPRSDCPSKITSGPNNPNISYSYGPKERIRFKAD